MKKAPVPPSANQIEILTKKVTEKFLPELKEIFPTYSVVISHVTPDHLQLKLSSSKNNFDAVITDDISKKLEKLFNTEEITMIGYRNKNNVLTNLRAKRQSFKDHMCTIEVKNYKMENSTTEV